MIGGLRGFGVVIVDVEDEPGDSSARDLPDWLWLSNMAKVNKTPNKAEH